MTGLLTLVACMAVASVKVGGVPGAQMEAVIRSRLCSAEAKGAVYDEAERAFATCWDGACNAEGRPNCGWQGEYWGKTMLGYAGAIEYTDDGDLAKWALDKAHRFIADHQRPNGYLSTYADEDELGIHTNESNPGFVWNFSVWSRKYTMWALLELHRVTGDKACLDAAEKMGDHLCAQLKRLNVGIEWTGSWAGLSNMTILKPLLLLYRHRPKPEYLELAKHIVEVNDTDEKHHLEMNLIHNALTGKPVHTWFADRAIYLAKAYELMSFWEGVIEYHRVTGSVRALEAAKAFQRHLTEEELDPMRSVGLFDHFLDARHHVNGMTELCDVIHWMRLNRELYLVTGDAAYLDWVEEAFYNAFLAGVSTDGKWAAHIVRSHGCRHLSAPSQSGMTLHQCCPDNMPRAFFDWANTVAVVREDGVVDVNFFSDATVDLPGFKMEILGNYPVADSFRLKIVSETPRKFRLRVPSWTSWVKVNGRRTGFSDGRLVLEASRGESAFEIAFDMRPRLLASEAPATEDFSRIPGQDDWYRPSYVQHFMEWDQPEVKGVCRRENSAQVMRGPLVLAKGTRIGSVDVLGIDPPSGRGWWIESLELRNAADVWGAWNLVVVRGNDRRRIPVGDFWSVSKGTDPENRFSVWFDELKRQPAADLAGDGVHDDTAAIQAMLDTGRALVELPAPEKEYLISKTLLIGDRQELRLPRFARVRLADGSNCHMVGVRDERRGANGVAVTGGIWDMNNLGQRHNLAAHYYVGPENRHRWLDKKKEYVQTHTHRMSKVHEPDYFLGVCMRFFNVKGLFIRDVTVRNPVCYGIQLWKTCDFSVADVTFDYQWGNPSKANMDGLHIDGHCHRGRITNLKGICFDDFVAINATDGSDSPEHGPIDDIDIDGIFCDYCHSAVRILSRSPHDAIRRIHINNVHGRYYSYGIGFTYFYDKVDERGVVDDVVISDCRMSRADTPADTWRFTPFGLIEFEPGVDVGSVTIDRLVRDESERPEIDTIRIREGATVARLTIRDCEQINRTQTPMYFLHNRGKIETLVHENTRLVGPGVRETDCTEERDFTWRIEDLESESFVRHPAAKGYPKRAAATPFCRTKAGFEGDDVMKLKAFVGEDANAEKGVIDTYTENDEAGYYCVVYTNFDIRVECVADGDSGYFRMRFPESVVRKCAVDKGLNAVFSVPPLNLKTVGNVDIYTFKPGYETITACISRKPIKNRDLDIDRAGMRSRQDWWKAVEK